MTPTQLMAEIIRQSGQISGFTKVFEGARDPKLQNAISVYRKGSTQNKPALGGMVNKSYVTESLDVLYHMNEDTRLSEFHVEKLDQYLNGLSSFNIGSIRVISVVSSGPMFLGRDDRGIVEYTARYTIAYER
jgi:hypothetical protein